MPVCCHGSHVLLCGFLCTRTLHASHTQFSSPTTVSAHPRDPTTHEQHLPRVRGVPTPPPPHIHLACCAHAHCLPSPHSACGITTRYPTVLPAPPHTTTCICISRRRGRAITHHLPPPPPTPAMCPAHPHVTSRHGGFFNTLSRHNVCRNAFVRHLSAVGRFHSDLQTPAAAFTYAHFARYNLRAPHHDIAPHMLFPTCPHTPILPHCWHRIADAARWRK